MRAVWAVVVLGCGSPSKPPSPAEPPKPATPSAAVDDPFVDAPPSADGAIGTPHPAQLRASARDGSWLVLCQAREDTDKDGKTWVGVGMHGSVRGDRLAPYLVLGSGAGMPIDDFVTATDDGKQLVVVRNGKLELIEPANKRRIAFPDADLRDDDDPRGGARFATIAANGSRMAYMRHVAGAKDQIVIRTLATGATKTIDIDGALWRIALDEAGRWARIAVMTKDTDGDGKIRWPVANTNLAKRGCRGTVGSYTSGPDGGDAPAWRWLDVETGEIVDDASVRRAVGDRLLRIMDDASIRLGDETIADARCKPLAVKTEPPRVVVGCGKHVEIRGPNGFAKKTPLTTNRSDGVYALAGRAYCETGCVDVVTGEPLAIPKGAIEMTLGDRLLLRHGKQYLVYDLATEQSTPLDAKGELAGNDGSLVMIGEVLYDLETGKRVGALDAPILAHANGRLLVGTETPLDCSKDPAGLPYACGNPAAGGSMGIPNGPLRWR